MSDPDFLFETFHLKIPGWSNARLPVLLYRGAIIRLNTDDDLASRFEARFQEHRWPPQWRDGVYTFHHYHSNAHEVLGFAAGAARLRLGGPEGIDVDVKAGDAVLLPAGTGHFQISADAAFLVVGAYPPEQQNFDICRTPADSPLNKRIASLDFPQSDPIYGSNGPVSRLWMRRN